MGTEAAILVVGAGPTGLLLASELERRGVPCHLIDARPGPQHWDRATVVHPRSMQIFESMGLAAKFLEAGCRQRIIKIHSNGEVLGTLDLDVRKHLRLQCRPVGGGHRVDSYRVPSPTGWRGESVVAAGGAGSSG